MKAESPSERPATPHHSPSKLEHQDQQHTCEDQRGRGTQGLPTLSPCLEACIWGFQLSLQASSELSRLISNRHGCSQTPSRTPGAEGAEMATGHGCEHHCKHGSSACIHASTGLLGGWAVQAVLGSPVVPTSPRLYLWTSTPAAVAGWARAAGPLCTAQSTQPKPSPYGSCRENPANT